MKKWVCDLALSLAQQSKFPQFRHAAVIECGGRIVGTGINVQKPKSPQASMSMHAEVAALKRIKTVLARQKRPRKFDIYIARVDKGNLPAFSMPCPKCLSALIKSNLIETVNYSTDKTWKSFRI